MPDILGIAAAGVQSSLRQLESISNNVAHVNTQGYKREFTVNRPFQAYMAGPTADQPQPSAYDPSAGPLRFTGSAQNLAIEGHGYFQLQTPGGVLLTRNGQFHIDQQGQLVSAEGWPVVLKSPVAFDDPNFKVLGDGTIVVADQQTQLDLVDASPESLRAAGPGLFRAQEARPISETGVNVRQGYLENSNVNSLTEMVDLIRVSRHIQSSQQLMRAYDEIMDSAITQLGEF